MATTDIRTRFRSKHIVGLTALGTRMLEFLVKAMRDVGKKVWPLSGLFEHVNLVAAGPDAFSVTPTPVEGVDNLGHLLYPPNAQVTAMPFENALGVDYYVALKYANYGGEEPPSLVETNPETSVPEYTTFEEVVGHMSIPDTVVDNGNGTMTFRVDSVTEAGVSNAGRQVKVWLATPATSVQASAFETRTVAWAGGQNKITTVGTFGQGTPSVVAANYRVMLIGPRVSTADLSLLADHAYIGKVTGAGAGNPPAAFNMTGQWNPVSFSDLAEVIEVCAHGDYKICVTAEGVSVDEPQITVKDSAGNRVFKVDEDGDTTMTGMGVTSPALSLVGAGGGGSITLQNNTGELELTVPTATDAIVLRNTGDPAKSALLRFGSTAADIDLQALLGILHVNRSLQVDYEQVLVSHTDFAQIQLATSTGGVKNALIKLDAATGNLILNPSSGEVTTPDTLSLDAAAANSPILRLDSTGGDATIQNANSTLTLTVQNAKVVKVTSPGGSAVLEIDAALQAVGTMSLDDANINPAVPVSSATDTTLDAQFSNRLGGRRNLLYATNVSAEQELQFKSLLGPSIQSGCGVTDAGGTSVTVASGYVTLQGQRFSFAGSTIGLGPNVTVYVYLRATDGTAVTALNMGTLGAEDALVARVTTGPAAVTSILDLRLMMRDEEKCIDIYAGNARGTHFATLAAAVAFVGEMVNSALGAIYTHNWRIRVSGECNEVAATPPFATPCLPIPIPCDGIIIEGGGIDSGSRVVWGADLPLFNLTGQSRIVIRDLLIQYSGTGNFAVETRMVLRANAGTSRQITLSNVTFSYTGAGGRPHGLVYVSAGAAIDRLLIDNCTVDGASDFIAQIRGDTAIIRSSEFIKAGTAQTPTKTGIALLSGGRHVVHGCRFIGPFEGHIIDLTGTHSKVSDCDIDCSTSPLPVTVGGIHIAAVIAKDCVVGNTINMADGPGMLIEGSHSLVTGNLSVTGGVDVGDKGIVIQGAGGLWNVVVGNQWNNSGFTIPANNEDAHNRNDP